MLNFDSHLGIFFNDINQTWVNADGSDIFNGTNINITHDFIHEKQTYCMAINGVSYELAAISCYEKLKLICENVINKQLQKSIQSSIPAVNFLTRHFFSNDWLQSK